MSSANVPGSSPAQRSQAHPPEPTPRLSGRTIAALILVSIALAFVFSNLSSGTIMFLGFRFVMPVWIWFLVVLIVGVVIGSLFPWFRPKRKK
jgi:uncharacterized integral membrane protein